jgi:hypothetical protein
MTTSSYARLLLEHWGIGVVDIPTSDKEESDFLATFGPVKVLIEEKTKLDDPAHPLGAPRCLRVICTGQRGVR